MRAYLDASTVIFRFEGRPELRARVARRFREIDGEGGELLASELTRLECRVGPLRDGDQNLMQVYEGFFSSREVTLTSISRRAWEFAAEVRARHRLKTPDALHVACAVTTGCDLLLTGDERLARCAEIRTELIER